MPIIIFVIILAVLIFVHELGHFLVAKKSGIKVSEFGLGFPPKLWSKKYGETEYTLNAIPFGGFVKIFGENPDQESISGPEKERSFVNKSRPVQAAVLVAGVAFNLIFAWLLISVGFMSGLPSSVSSGVSGNLQNVRTVVTAITPKSPAEQAGIRVGDSILSLRSGGDSLMEVTPESVQNFVTSHKSAPLDLKYARAGKEMNAVITPVDTLIAGRFAVGISMDMVGLLKLSPPKAVWEGAKLTVNLFRATAVGLASFIGNAFTLRAHLSDVTGPVGIVSLVGSASELGFIYLLSFTAFISINLAVINLIPFPALDGGRLLFVIIEGVRRKPLNQKVMNTLNSVGFILLLVLMLVVTVQDIFKLI